MKIHDYGEYTEAKKKVVKYEFYRKFMLYSLAPYMLTAFLRILIDSDWMLYAFVASTIIFFIAVLKNHQITMMQTEIRSFEWKYDMWKSSYNRQQDHLGIDTLKIDY
jgi:hypothetical protein